jgi:ParB family chromosome partitioning protein
MVPKARSCERGGVFQKAGRRQTPREQPTMELRTVDPRTLKINPNNPRRTQAGKFSDDQMLASIKASGLLQPPLVREDGEDLVIQFGHRRVAACVKLKMDAMPVLVKAATEADDAEDSMGAVSENVIRAEMGRVDRWRAMEALATAGWNDAAIAEALGMTPRNIAQARLLANICPGMLDQMALNDLPDQRELRMIAAASKEEQAQVWEKYKPKRGNEASWGEITHALSKVRLRARDAKRRRRGAGLRHHLAGRPIRTGRRGQPFDHAGGCIPGRLDGVAGSQPPEGRVHRRGR